MECDETYKLNYGKLHFYLRTDVPADYWCFEGLLFADEYWPLKLSPVDIVLDVGANIGIFTVACAKKVRMVISIEPEAENFKLLTKNVKENSLPNVYLLNYAVSDIAGIVRITGTGGTAHVSAESGLSANAKTLDGILEEIGNPEISVLKIDIEGYEYKALSTFHALSSVRQIIVETHSGLLTDEVINLLEEKGFSISDVSKIKRVGVLKRIALHPLSFLNAERKNSYSTLRSLSNYVFGEWIEQKSVTGNYLRCSGQEHTSGTSL